MALPGNYEGAANFQAFQLTGQAFQAPRPKDNVFHRQNEIIALHTLSPQWENEF